MIWKYFIAQHSENLGKVCNLPTESLFLGLGHQSHFEDLSVSVHLELDSHFYKAHLYTPGILRVTK